MNSTRRRSLLISNLHCDHICLKNDIIKKMNVLITAAVISPLAAARPPLDPTPPPRVSMSLISW